MLPTLYFAFPDGALDYVCAECNALCCRVGHSFSGSLNRELKTLLRLYPSLESMALGRVKDDVYFPLPRSGCVFLEPDNRCGIQTRHGRELKPSGCLLFPFNVLTPIGGALAVRPNFICPIRVVAPARPGAVAGTHRTIAAEIRSGELPERKLPRAVSRATRVEIEVAFRDRCAEALGSRRFSDVVRGASPSPEQLAGRIARCTAILGVELPLSSGPRDCLDDVLLAIAPAFRIELARVPAEGKLLALALGERLVRRALRLEQGTAQAVWDLLSGLAPALRLLGGADEPLRVPPKIRRKAPRFGDAEMTFAAYELLKDAGAGDVLERLERAMRRLAAPVDRCAFLVQTGLHIESAAERRTR
jgi:hypothetical protein